MATLQKVSILNQLEMFRQRSLVYIEATFKQYWVPSGMWKYLS